MSLHYIDRFVTELECKSLMNPPNHCKIRWFVKLSFLKKFYYLNFQRGSSSFKENLVNKLVNFSPLYLKNIARQFSISVNWQSCI